MEKITYKDIVDYEAMDPFKVLCQAAAKTTAKNAERLGAFEINWTRGESAFGMHFKKPIDNLSQVEEGLGTKNLVADKMYQLTGKTYYDHIAQDTVAMIVNDMVTLGSFPISVAMHLAAGDSEWFNDKQRCEDLINGWRDACNMARCIWGPGETPTLKGLVYPGTVVISGSGIGELYNSVKPSITSGDCIIMLESSGIHANGLSSARKLADERLPDGYLTRLSDGRTFGETLLDPTHIYVAAIDDLYRTRLGNFINYMVNITGHGWRKLMRLEQPFTYHIHTLPQTLPIFDFMQKHLNVDDEEMYSNYNMGAGFALIVRKRSAGEIVDYFNRGNYGFKAFEAGSVKDGSRQVIIEPKNLTFKGETLDLR